MIDRILILLPVKACSGRLPGKNLKDLCGKPLFYWALDVAMEAGKEIEAPVYVSTESWKVVDLACERGAFPVCRPEYLAHDPYQIVDVCLHALETLRGAGKKFDTLIMVQPSNPFVEVKDIVSCHDIFCGDGKKRPVRMVSEVKNRAWLGLEPAYLLTDETMHCFIGAGSVIVVGIDYFLNHGFSSVCIPYVVAGEKTIDIDTEFDFETAKFWMERRLLMNEGHAACQNEAPSGAGENH